MQTNSIFFFWKLFSRIFCPGRMKRILSRARMYVRTYAAPSWNVRMNSRQQRKSPEKGLFRRDQPRFFQKMLLVQRAQRGYMYVHFFSFLSYAREHFVPLFNIRASSSPRLFIAQLLLQRLPGTNVHVWNKETSAYNWKKRKYCYRVLYLCPQALSYYRPLFNYKVFPFFVHTITPSFAFVIALWPSRIGMWGS